MTMIQSDLSMDSVIFNYYIDKGQNHEFFRVKLAVEENNHGAPSPCMNSLFKSLSVGGKASPGKIMLRRCIA